MNQELLKKQCLGFLNTAPLWRNQQFGIQQFELPKINLKAFPFQPIPEKIRLGHQMEYVFKQLIQYTPSYQILLHNLAIRKGKVTIGEIDFILNDSNSSRIVHVELTYKFYLIIPEVADPIHQLIGPNRKDSFFTKMEKIKNKQFPLLHSPEGISALETMNINHSEIIHKTCYKAQLFSPYTSYSNNITPLNNTCIIGVWLRFDDFKSDAFKKQEYYIPQKSEWVITPHKDVHWSSHSETLQGINLILNQGNSPMLWLKKSQTKFEKFFVVWW